MYMKNKIDQNRVILALFYVIPIVIMFYCFGSGISGNDFWWHIKVGEYVVENQTVPTTDIFSWYGVEQGIEWTAHEWLADVIFFLIFNCFGSVGIFIFALGSAVLLYACLWNVAKRYNSNNILFSGLFFSLFAVLSSLFFYGRPHVFSYFLLFFELALLYDFYENPKSKKVYLIPAIAVLWSNLHGGSSNLAYILCLLFLVCGIFNVSFGRIENEPMTKRNLVKLGGITLATILAILVNPIGVRVLSYPYVNLSDELSMTLISEWQAPDAKLIGNIILYYLPIVLMSIGLLSENKKIRLIDLVVMLSFLFLFFRSARFIVLWYIAASFYAFRYIPHIRVKEIKKVSEKIAVGALAILLLLPLVVGVSEGVKNYQNEKLISTVISDEAIESIKSDSPKRIFNDYNIGETLIYNDIPVFFDARADLYAQENIMADGASLMYLEQANKTAEKAYVDVDGLIEKYSFDAVAILKVRPLYSYIVSHPERFSLVYEDSTVAYYRIIGGAEDE